MAWRLANSLVTFRDQINAKFPGRSTISDGTIGDAAHAARLSQHNPNSAGVVCAIDITEDLSVGLDCNRLMEELDASNDARIFYIIHDRQIDNSDDSRDPYYGSNPHTRHLHLSVKYTEPGRYDDARPWNLPLLTGGAAPAPTPAAPGVQYEARVDAALGSRVLSVGKVGNDVSFVQRWHGITDDGRFGPATRNAVAATQNRNGVLVDGVVGPITWRLMGIGAAPAKPTPPPTPWLSLPAVRSRPRSFQTWYNRYPFKPALLPIIKPLADAFGPQSLAALKKVQARYGLAADGVDGPKTKQLLWNLGWRG